MNCVHRAPVFAGDVVDVVVECARRVDAWQRDNSVTYSLYTANGQLAVGLTAIRTVTYWPRLECPAMYAACPNMWRVHWQLRILLAVLARTGNVVALVSALVNTCVAQKRAADLLNVRLQLSFAEH